MKKKILITGSNGLLGQKLIHLLSGHPEIELIATARGENRVGDIGLPYTFESMDITQPEEIALTLSLHKPQIIIHTAAMTNVDQCEAEKENCRLQNVEAVRYLLQEAEKINAFFLHLSTDFIFDGTSGPYSEEDLPQPISFYGQSKLDAEILVQQSKCRWAIARTVLVYGIVKDMSRSNIILWVKKNLEEGKKINVVSDQWRTPTLAEDLAMGCLLIAQKEAEGIFNLSGKDFLTPYDMAIQTAVFFGLDKSFIQEANSNTFKQAAQRPPRTGFKLDKAQKQLGYAPHSFREGLEVLKKQLTQHS